MKRLVILSLILAACGDNIRGGATDARIDSPPMDTAMIDSPDVDAPIDAMPTPAERVEMVRAASNGVIDIDLVDVTVTYLKPLITGATPANDPAGFTVQVGNTGPALFVAVDPTTLTLTPALAVGDVLSFTVTEKAASGSSPRATMISDVTRTATATDVAPLVQDITAVTGIVGMIADFDSELVDVTAATIVEAFGASGNAFSRARITTAGVTALDNNFQLRLPTVFKDTLDLEVGCVVAVHRTPVNRFAAQFQVSAFNTTDLTITSCPAPTVMAAAATDATHVTVTFTRNIDMATVLANGSQFTIVEDATPANTLGVSAAAVTGPRTITLTTATQATPMQYKVTVLNTVKDTVGGAIGTPDFATFPGYAIVIPTVMMAAATAATTVNVTFTRNIDMASVMANGSQFTIVEELTPANMLDVTAATVSGMVVTLTTAAQTPGTMYRVTVVNSVTDTIGTPVGAPLSAVFLGFTPAAPVNHLVINEVDYDQTGADANSFIEIYNPTSAPIPLADFAVVYGNGNGGVIYPTTSSRVMLSTAATELPAGGYLVIANTAVAVLGGALKIDVGTGDLLQNGPDGVGLINTSTNTLVDSLFYGTLTGTTTSMMTIMGFAAAVDFIEAPAFTTGDTTSGSLGRFPNGADTNHAMADWALRTTPTPGLTN